MTQADAFVDEILASYRGLALGTLLDEIPTTGPRYLYDLLPAYASRPSKGLRASLCLATCVAMGGDLKAALNTAVAIELFHNAFLIHDDVQDGSEKRRGHSTLHLEHGVGIAVNVGNATNLLALDRLMRNRELLGHTLSWRLLTETEEMFRHTLEGQAIELSWIRDNVVDLADTDYYRMCLKKSSWYTCIFPMRAGALIARTFVDISRLFHFGWYLGASFQIQDDILNLDGDYRLYGKEIGGDLLEGKRTLILIHLLRTCRAGERADLVAFLAKPRHLTTDEEAQQVLALIHHYGSLDYARLAANGLAEAAVNEAERIFDGLPDSPEKRFLIQMPSYVTNRSR